MLMYDVLTSCIAVWLPGAHLPRRVCADRPRWDGDGTGTPHQDDTGSFTGTGVSFPFVSVRESVCKI